MPDLTICIPIGPGHAEKAERARESVKAQTVDVAGVAYYDKDGHGAGFARNRLLDKVTTPYVSFLDADDWLEPEFARVTLQELRKVEAEGKYVYSGWFEVSGAQRIANLAPARCYCFDNGWLVHLVNAVIPTDWARAVAGFDEKLPGMEDTDFFHKLHEAGHCGWGISTPLVNYTADGNRSVAFRNRSDYLQIKEQIGERYHKPTMSCCGGQMIANEGPYNEKQPGDVLAVTLGASFIRYVGRRSGRIYEGGGHGQLVWASPADVQADPMRFKLSDKQPPTSALDIGEFMNGQRQNVRLPEGPTPKPGTITPSALAKMAGFDNE